MQVKRAVVRGENQVELESVQISAEPGPHEVLIETETTFISAGTELANYTGVDPTVHEPGAWNAYPKVPGYANAGRVVSRGAEVEGFAEGARVYTLGPHVSHHIQATTGDTSMMAEIPDPVDSDVAAAARMAGVAITALQTSSVQVHDRVAVFGLGMVGNLTA